MSLETEKYAESEGTGSYFFYNVGRELVNSKFRQIAAHELQQTGPSMRWPAFYNVLNHVIAELITQQFGAGFNNELKYGCRLLADAVLEHALHDSAAVKVG